jgi:hypothetical protein
MEQAFYLGQHNCMEMLRNDTCCYFPSSQCDQNRKSFCNSRLLDPLTTTSVSTAILTAHLSYAVDVSIPY